MKFRICIIAVMLIASAALAVKAVRMSKAVRLSQQEPVVVKTQDTTLRIMNNRIDGKWINVPIEITSLGGHNYRVTNKSGMGIKRLMIALYAATVGKPAHGPDARRHMVQVRITDRPTIEPGKWIDINIEENLKEFSSAEHNHSADMHRMDMIPYVVDFADAFEGKRWMGGQYLRATATGWELDPDLNPKENKDVVGAASSTQVCIVYDWPSSNTCINCDTGDPTCDTIFVSFRQQRMIFWKNHALLPKAYTRAGSGMTSISKS